MAVELKKTSMIDLPIAPQRFCYLREFAYMICWWAIINDMAIMLQA